LLEEMRIKLSSTVSDLLGVSGTHILTGLADGETDPAKLAALAEPTLRATPEQLCDALSNAPVIKPSYRYLLRQYLERIRLCDRHIEELAQALAECLKPHESAVARLAEVPGLGVDSAQQIIAEVGPKAAVFPSDGDLCSWVGTCPGKEESAEKSKSDRSPKGNGSCAAFSTRPPTRRSSRKVRFLKPITFVSEAEIPKNTKPPYGPSPTACAVSCGSFSTAKCVMRSADARPIKRRVNTEPGVYYANFARLATPCRLYRNYPLRRASPDSRGDGFRRCRFFHLPLFSMVQRQCQNSVG
jgi:hypothetical protein